MLAFYEHPRRCRSVNSALSPKWLLLLATILSLSIAVSPALADGEDPGQSVEQDLSIPGNDELGAGDPERAARLAGIASELRQIAEKYGPDVVILETHLLMKSLEAGAVLPVEVRVEGSVASGSGPLLEIQVDTGLLLDSRESSSAERRQKLESLIVEPALTQMRSFNMDPAGLRLSLGVATQDPSLFPDGKLDVDAAVTTSREIFNFSADQLAAYSTTP
jgi:hypothetical protein